MKEFEQGLMLDGNPLKVFERTLDRLTPEYIERAVREMEEERRG
jgi:hypothetical protein